jgi:hypothetical protein
MITGQVLFSGDTPPAIMLAHFKSPALPAVWPAGVPARIGEVLAVALSPELEKRYASASEMMRALEKVAEDKLAKPYGALEDAVAAGHWNRALQLARSIRVQEANYRDVGMLEERAVAGRERAQRATRARQWQQQAQEALAEGNMAGARTAALQWQKVAPEDEYAYHFLAKLAEPVTPAGPVEPVRETQRPKKWSSALLGAAATGGIALICLLSVVLLLVHLASTSTPEATVLVVVPDTSTPTPAQTAATPVLIPTLMSTQTPTPNATATAKADALSLGAGATSTAQVRATATAQANTRAGDSHDALRAQVEANVIEIRGLQPITPVQATFLAPVELRQRLEADFEEDYSLAEARQDAIVYSAFDFLDRDFDLYNFWLDLYSEQIAGFYDTDTAEFVVISEEQQFGPSEQWTHAHEFVHALQDQHFDLGRINDDELDPEARLALRALAEGEATLVQLLYLDYFTEAEIAQIFAGMNQGTGEMLRNAPAVLRAGLEFPYSAGFEFVTALYRQGDFAAIDAAWSNPPRSTEHILHPERYLAGDDPLAVTLAPLTATLGAGWELVDEDVLGEFYLRQYLLQQLSSQEVDVAATGWGGDWYAVYWNESTEQLVMVLRSVWDTAGDSDEFASAYGRYAGQLTGAAEQAVEGGRCWSGLDVICLYHQGSETLVVRAPDLTTMSRIAAVQQVRPAP